MTARTRDLRPGFFKNESLAELSREHRLLFAGLWGLCDRRGVTEDRPKRIKAEVFPYDDDITGPTVDGMLADLAEHRDRFIIRYVVDGNRYLVVTNFEQHQRPHPKEAVSKLPPPPGGAATSPGPAGELHGSAGELHGSAVKRYESRKEKKEQKIPNVSNLPELPEASKKDSWAAAPDLVITVPAQPTAPAGAAPDTAPGHPDPEHLAEAIALCRADPYLAEMIDPAETVARCARAHPELDPLRVVKLALAHLSPEQLAIQRRKGKGPAKFLVSFFDVEAQKGHRERIRAPADGARADPDPAAERLEIEAKRQQTAQWERDDLKAMAAERRAAAARRR